MEKMVKIFTTPGCHYCIQAKEYFTEKGIAFEAFDVLSDPEAMQEMKRLTGGGRSVPGIAIQKEASIGFDREAAEKAPGA
jgi:glutaredoxin 3